VEEIRAAGIEMHPFGTRQGSNNRFQVNFRNHRKIVVVDGRRAWVGGHNVGDEYLGLDPKVGPWRDTHVRIEGPAALGAQMTFLLDWYWATRERLDLSWDPVVSDTTDRHALVISTGPADELETAKLFFMHAINSAKTRVWIATPYFIPDPAVTAALQLAALRGLDIRIITPKHNDSRSVQLSSYYFIQELDGLGIRFSQYREGFMHQKVMLVDDVLSFVGTHNFDSRSFVLNFEVTAVVYDREFAQRMEAMFEKDLERTDPLDPKTLAKKPVWHRFAVRLCRLMSPVQ
jgi:cardiolipin synthase